MDGNFVVIDLETTGLDPISDQIIEVGLVRLEQSEITEKYHTLVHSGQPLPLRIKRLTGLDDGDLTHAPAISGVMQEIMDFIGDSDIAGHNVRFDLGFLAAARGLPLRNRAYDTLELARLVAPGAPTYRLEALCTKFNIKNAAVHRALSDATATAQLLVKLLQKLREMNAEILTYLNKLLREARSEWHEYLNIVFIELIKNFPDRKISTLKYWHRINDQNDQNRERSSGKTRLELKEKDAKALLKKGGSLSEFLPSYEYRPQQEAMVVEVIRAINEEKYLLMEAGTGVGKSMAYLIPAVLWSLLNNERVLVATHTINLQEQLWFKDIPLLAKIINKPFRVAMAKGRQNYICLRRWLAVLDDPHWQEEATFYAKVLTWLAVTETGDRSEINVFSGEEDYWFAICGEADGCLGSRCHYQKDCFVNKARKAAEEADLIITNHSLLFSDIRAENRVLPAYGPLIIDEAHHLEESATTHLGKQFSQRSVNRWLSMAGKAMNKLAEKAPPRDGPKWFQAIKDAQTTKLEVTEAVRLFFKLMHEIMADSLAGGDSEYSRLSFRLPFSDDLYNELLISGEKCIELMRKLTEEIKYCAGLMELWAISEEAWAGPSRDIAQISQSGKAITDDFRFILENKDENYVYWAELELYTRGQVRNCTLTASPIDVGMLLYEKFFANKKNVIFTSATLTVNGSFDHFIERNGLNNLTSEMLMQSQFDSPFAYNSQALLCINRDLPVQGSVPEDIYMERLENALFKLIKATGGRTLVLFTSHRTLRETYRRLKPRLEVLDICLLGHGIDGSRSKILEEFKTDGKTALFGASSFWEGVDVPGEALTCVIMVKLPFMSPSVPVIEARLKDLARKNRDGFKVLSVPQAVIRFKQGFGRLIRSSSDRGCVIVLERRILDKSYGRHFLISLPLNTHFRGGIDLISKKMLEWMKDNIESNMLFVNTWKDVNLNKSAHLNSI